MTQKLVLAPKPFEAPVTHALPGGRPIDALLDDVSALPADRSELRVFIDGREVPVDLWGMVVPPAGSLVQVGIDLGNRNIIRTFAQIAVIAAAAAASLINPALGAAVGILGGLAVSALFRPPEQSFATPIEAESGPDQGQASLAGNVLAKNRPLPRVCGLRKVYPPAITYPITELIGDDEFAEVIFGLAGPHEMSNHRAGDTLVAELDDVEIEQREGRRGEKPLRLFRRYGYEQQLGIAMSETQVDRANPNNLLKQATPGECLPTWHRVTTRCPADEIWLTLLWPEGLFDDDDPTVIHFMPFRIRFRLLGSTTWINGPELHAEWRRAQAFKLAIKLMWITPPAIPSAPTTGGFVRAYCEVPAQETTPYGGDWQSHAAFDAGSGLTNVQNVALYSDRAEIYLSEGTFPKGRYEIELIHGRPMVSSSFTASTYKTSGTVLSPFLYTVDDGVYTAGSGFAGKHQRVNMLRLASVVNGNPVPLGGDAHFGIRVKNRALDNISVEAAGLVPTYDARTEEWIGHSATTDPAAHMRFALIGNLTAYPQLPRDLLDEASFLAFREFCADEGLEINAVLEGQSLWDALTLIAAAGNGEPRASEKWGVIWERDRSAETPIQVFSPRNARGFKASKSFDLLPDAIVATFANSANNYQEEQVTVFADDVNANDPDLRYEERSYDWIVDSAAAQARALLDLRMERNRDTLYEIETSYDARLCLRGDLIGVQHDVWDRDGGSGLVKAVATSGSNVTGLTLDAFVPHYADADVNSTADINDVLNFRLLGETASAQIRLLDGSILTKDIDGPTGDSATIAFSTPFAMPTHDFGDGAESLIAPGCLVTVGRQSVETKRMLVTGISRRSGETLALTLLDEKPEIHA